MKSTRTIKSLLGAALLIFSGSILSFAQSNGAAVSPNTGVTSEHKTLFLSVDENTVRSGVTDKLTAEFTSVGILAGDFVKLNGKLVMQVDIPAGTPVGTTFNVSFDDKPLWHVTVADILGQSESEGTGMDAMRPIDVSSVISLTNTTPGGGSNPTSVSTPSTVNTGSGLGSGKNQPKMDVYPNPATDQITIVTEGEVLWGVTEVIDITGKKVLEIPTGSNAPATGIDRLTIQVSQLKPGTYILRFKTDKDTYTKRFQVAR